MKAEKFFTENLNLFVSAQKDPKEHNLHAGLLAMAQQLTALQSQAAMQQQQLARIEALLAQLGPRLR